MTTRQLEIPVAAPHCGLVCFFFYFSRNQITTLCKDDVSLNHLQYNFVHCYLFTHIETSSGVNRMRCSLNMYLFFNAEVTDGFNVIHFVIQIKNRVLAHAI